MKIKTKLFKFLNVINKTFIHMLRIAGQTAGSIGLNFLWTLMGDPRACYWLKKIEIIFFSKMFYFSHGLFR